MEECKVGEYVRTMRGNIGQFKSYGKGDDTLVYFKNGWGLTCVDRYEIAKHSENIIDLIEVDDIVEVLDNEIGCKAKIHIYDNLLLETVKEDIQNKNYELIGIASHELFESIKYEV